MRLGIDLGTTRTVIAAAEEGRYPVASFELAGQWQDHLPGIAALGDDGLCFGTRARQALIDGAGGAVASIKRAVSKLSPEATVPELGAVTALDLVTAYLRYVRAMLLEHSNLELSEGEPLQAMVAVPAHASTRQRFTTLEAFKRAGFEVTGLLGEPTAAAVEFAHRNRNVLSARSPKRYVVVYDLGGGTFDTAAVSLVDRRFDLLAAEGIASLGGADFDALVLHLATQQAGIDASTLSPSASVRLLEHCRESKEGLRPGSRRLLIDLSEAGLGSESIVLDTAELYAQCQPLIERTVQMVDRLFADLAGRGVDVEDARQLGGLYLVGGSSAFPAVARTLRQRFGKKIQLATQPHAATAVGLAIAGDPRADIFVRETITRHFGVWREAEHGQEKIFDPILTKNAEPPVGKWVVQRRYHPAHGIGHLRFMECSALDEHGQPAGDLTPWDEIRFPYDPTLADNEELDALPVTRSGRLDEDIRETYTHAPDGTIAVAIENITRGYRREYVLGAL